MWGTKIHYRHMWALGALVVEGTREGRSRVRIQAAAKRVIFMRKMSRLCSWQLFDLKSSCGPYRVNWPVGGWQVLNVLRWRNYQNESCRNLWNFVVDDFLIWNHLLGHIGQIVFVVYFVVYFSTGRQVLNDLGWRNYQNESCRSQKVMKLWRL
jgi:hypothetical protein